MMEFEIDSRVQPIGKREGQTVYFAKLKTRQKLTNQMVIERIVRETSLSEGDVKNALVSDDLVWTNIKSVSTLSLHVL